MTSRSQAMGIAYIIPTRDRPHILRRTLTELATLAPHDAQVIVVDNASANLPQLPRRLDNGLSVELIRSNVNLGAAARNTGVQAADPRCDWVVMLDDDSAPLGEGHLRAMREAPEDVAAVAAEIFLEGPAGGPGQSAGASRGRESGGLPEVFVGCGAAIRRRVFLDCGGYDPAFGYYAEEYDLSAKLLLAGMRVTLDRRFQVLHRKVTAGRDMNTILRRLVRNNGWVMQRYAPARRRVGELRRTIDRYAAIARKEHATTGFELGLEELARTVRAQRRSPMPAALWRRFTGMSAALAALEGAMREEHFATAALVDEGKNTGVVRAALAELGVRVVAESRQPDALVIGTLSPGPMLDAWERRIAAGGHRVLMPWDLACPAAGMNLAAA